MFKKIFPLLRDIAIVIGGNIIYACGVAFFVLPGGLITGGTTGIALFIQHLFGVPISTFVLCFNAVMFFLGLVVLGRKFAATTILSTFVYPIALEMIQRLSNGFVITTDPVLCTVFSLRWTIIPCHFQPCYLFIQTAYIIKFFFKAFYC